MCILYFFKVSLTHFLLNAANKHHLHSFLLCIFRGRVSNELQGPEESGYLRRIHHIQVQIFFCLTLKCACKDSHSQTAWKTLVVSYLFCWLVARRSQGADTNSTGNRSWQVISRVFGKYTSFIFPFRDYSFSNLLFRPFICNFLTIQMTWQDASGQACLRQIPRQRSPSRNPLTGVLW